MRLRQLATTQSITFFAPPEVYRSILDMCHEKHGMLDMCRGKPRTHIDSFDVVHWLLEQTCRNNELLQSLFYAQGVDFCRRTNAFLRYPKFLSEKADKSALLDVIKLPEQMTLNELYGPVQGAQRSNESYDLSPGLSEITKELEKYRLCFEDSSLPLQNSVMEEVEQEREVEFQVEEVRQVQRPRHYKGLCFPGLHPAISSFVQTGLLDGGSGFEPAGTFLAKTRLGEKYNVRTLGSRLFVSAEFTHTIRIAQENSDDTFLVSLGNIISLSCWLN